MKTIEEKAKAYDEAIKKAKKDLEVCEQDCLVAKQIFRYFPELCESEDEKTRKGIIRCVIGNMPDSDIRKKIHCLA